MLESGDVVLASMQFTDTFEVKKRPAVVLFEEHGNVIAVGVTSNPEMDGIPLTKKEGAVMDSVIKTNYIFTITEKAVEKRLFSLSRQKKVALYSDLERRLHKLKE
ncbi:MAG: type II toxin-antitoxin system PemK/MazF family toxin [archaeon]